MQARKLFTMTLCVLILGGHSGCSNAPEVRQLSDVEREKLHQDAGQMLLPEVKDHLRLLPRTSVNSYLEKISLRLLKQHPKMRNLIPKIELVKDRDEKWRSFALPEMRLYLSVGLTKRCETESELAALIALEISHLAHQDLIERYSLIPLEKTDLPKVDLSFEEAFEFSDQQYQRAVRTAVQLLYLTGYDPRGIVAVFQKLGANPARSPYGGQSIEQYIQWGYEAISSYTPLRNPIVRTEEFLAERPRIQQL